MLRISSTTWRPLAVNALLSGLSFGSSFGLVYAADKQPKSENTAARGTERVARNERAEPKLRAEPKATAAPRKQGSNQGGSSAQPQKFQPVFTRDGSTSGRSTQPRNLSLSAPTVNQFPSNANQRISVARNDGDKERNKSKPPKTDHPVQVKPQQPKPQPKIPANDPPKVVVPKVDMPKVVAPKTVAPKVDAQKSEIRAKKPEQPKVQVPDTVHKKPKEQPNTVGGSNRPPAFHERHNVGGNATGKAKGRTPEPEIKINLPENKTVGKGSGKLLTPKEDKSSTSKQIDARIDKLPRLKDGGTLTRDHHEKIRLDLDKQHRDLVKSGKMPDHVKVKLPTQIKTVGRERLERLPRESLKMPVPKNGKIDPAVATKLKLRPAHDVLDSRLKNGDFKHLANLKGGQQFQLHKQFEFRQKGDLSRRMNLVAGLHHRGGWRHRFFGPISPIYSRHCRSMWYSGPSFCSTYVWYPTWSPWVDWCWWDTCNPYYDPRPIYCRPVVYDPCSPWVAWNVPVWQPLPYVTCGTWVDVEPAIVSSGIDLQLLATRFVDPGHPDQELGSRLRVWVRNNTPVDVVQPFNVLLIASTDANAYAGLPEAGVRVHGIHAGETKAIDIRLPYSANTLGRDSSGHAIPFTYLTALVDSHNELSEANKANNGATLLRGDILPVDPSAFAAEPGSARPNDIIHVAGEGLGPEPGQAMVVIGDQEYQAEIVGWFDLGIQIRVPNFDLDTATAADLVIIRGDGAASNPLTIEIDPTPSLAQAPVAPIPNVPAPAPSPNF